MKKVCIALDYTPLSAKVAETGYSFAKAIGAEVTLIHVITDAAFYNAYCVPNMGYNPILTPSDPLGVDDVEDVAEEFLSTAISRLSDQGVNKVILEGSTADAILEFASENHMDLIVLGTHGHSGLEHLLLGNTAGRIVKYSTIPLLIVPTGNS